MKISRLVFPALVAAFFLAGFFYYFTFSAPKIKAPTETFVVARDTPFDEILADLYMKGFVRSRWAFRFVLSRLGRAEKITPGGYEISKAEDVWKVADHLTGSPDLKWITVYPGERKEQIGNLLGTTLGWTQEQIDNWNTLDPQNRPEYFEGVYFPDTYLIPVQESAAQIAQRMIDHFNEKFAPLSPQFLAKNIKWDTGLKIASLIQREAGGETDMPVISGIIWNRLLRGMKLDIDAAVQYALGSAERGWWPRLTPADLKVDSPYNTYLYSGLPPRPIGNPSLVAIEAVLHPAATDCLYYLHDSGGSIHCARTYEEHLQNIRKYLD